MNLTIVIVEKGRRGRPHSEIAPGSVRLLLVVKRLISLSLALTLVPALQAEAPCPGSAVSLRFPSIPRFQIIVPVGINHTVPPHFSLIQEPSSRSSIHRSPLNFSWRLRARPRSEASVSTLIRSSHALNPCKSVRGQSKTMSWSCKGRNCFKLPVFIPEIGQL